MMPRPALRRLARMTGASMVHLRWEPEVELWSIQVPMGDRLLVSVSPDLHRCIDNAIEQARVL